MILALLLTALAQLSPPCGQVYLGLGPTFPPDGTWHFECIGADGPWMLFYGTTPAALTYKGCAFYQVPVAQFGPFVGDMYTTFVPPSSMVGYWQIVSASQTSNPVHLL